MDEPSADGAVAAAEHVMALYRYANETGDLVGWSSISADDCQFCSAVADSIESVFAAGQRNVGPTIEILDRAGTEIIPSASYSATLWLEEGPTEVLNSDGVVAATNPGGRHQLYFALGWDGDWVVREVDVSDLPATTP